MTEPFASIVDFGFSLALIVAGGIFAFLALNMIVTSIRMWVLAQASKSWPATEGSVITAQVRPSGVRRVRFVPYVRYGYSVEGRYHVGNRICFESAQTYERDEAEKITASYPEGSPVNVYYDPARPAQSTLEQRHVGVLTGLVLGALVLVTPAALCLIPGLSFLVETITR
jgi:hypothetical protein